MMNKKTFIFFGIIGVIQLTIIACCPDPITYYNSINNLEVGNFNLRTQLDDSATITQDDFRIGLFFSVETFAQKLNPSFLVTSAYATSCDDNFVGLKSNITDFRITCNNDILNTPAGEPFDYSLLNVYKTGFTEDSKNQRMTIGEWLHILNYGGYLLAYEWYFEFVEPINSSEFLKFEIFLKQEDGTEFQVETSSVKIE